ncbi:AAA domain-containing protein [Rhodococcus ruber]
MTDGADVERRAGLVAAAVQRWRKDLIDVGRRNTLLYYKDLRVGTLTMEGVPPGPLTELFAGRPVLMSRLYPEETERAEARKRLRTIHKKIRELQEERGINAGYLTVGMATWNEPETQRAATEPMAPVILRQIGIKPRSAAEDDFELSLSDEPEINPVLLHVLADQFGIDINATDLVDLIRLDTPFDAHPVFERLTKQASRVSGFAIKDRTVIGTFTYAKLPMVNDLENGLELLQAHDVVAALAGDTTAQHAIRGDLGSIDEALPDHTSPQDEFLVADADSSQNYAINAVIAGNNLVIKGPPGTGKSQTITNLVATLIARGHRVLFVAEKRAAIDAVLSRLQRVDLGGLVMDLHDGAPHRRKVAQDLAAALERAGRIPPPNLTGLHRELTTKRARVLEHDRRMHQPRGPWQISVFDAQTRLLGLHPPDIDFRLHGPDLRNVQETVIAAAKDDLARYADLGGLAEPSASPWTGAPIATPDQARTALTAIHQLRDRTVPQFMDVLTTLLRQTGLPQPQTVATWPRVFRLVDAAAYVLGFFTPEIFTQDLSALVAATAPSSWRRENRVTLGWGERRRLVKQARSLWHGQKPSAGELHAPLLAAHQLVLDWRSVCFDGQGPRVPTNLDAAHAIYDQFRSELQDLGTYLPPTTDLETLTPTELPHLLDSLVGDQATLQRLPHRNTLEARLQALGLGPLIDECRRRRVGADAAAEVVEAVWLRSILDEISVTDTEYGAFQGASMNRTVEAYQHADTQHIHTTATRVQRSCAEKLMQALDQYPEQATLLRAEAGKKTRHRPMRDLLSGADDVLLALKPCWAMSPLVVSQVLPMQQLFDVVIFDEASQIPPADAVPAIARGKRVAVAGDERQLPPTSFFASAVADDPEGLGLDPGTVALTSGYESVLDVLSAIVPFRSLAWHYRSQDERLIAFSNAHIYHSSLTTFPGSHTEGVLQHVQVPFVAGAATSEESALAEVDKVVELILQYAQDRPEESLGVITMGIKHADRIEASLRSKLAARPELDEFFRESRQERFFIKNLERVQGDERDSIILSVGYGKGADGRMVYRFGPLNTDGGERRLNVAVSRAKRRMTLVSSFGSADLDPNRLNSRGAELLGAYIAFMESGGTDLGSVAAVTPQLNPFEIDVHDRLSRAGIPVTAQFGVSGYRIDFVASHPTQAGRMVLAIEADGASYHSSHTARDRDRLRQEHLERLGWRFHRIWSTDWFRDPHAEVAKALSAYQTAVRDADSGTAPARAARTAAQSDLEPTTHHVATRSLPKPALRPGYPITDYPPSELVALVRWIESDGLLRTEEEVMRAAMTELGYRKRGSRIVAALGNAIRIARRRTAEGPTPPSGTVR